MEPIILLTEMNYPRAALLQSMLTREGIPSFLSNIGHGDQESGVRVMIRKRDLTSALQVLQLMHRTLGSAPKSTLGEIKRIRRILVPVDFSEHAERAAYFALMLARELKGSLTLLHAYSSPVATSATIHDSFTYPDSVSIYLSELVENAEKEIGKLAENLRDHAAKHGYGNIEINTVLGHGLAGDVICNEEKELDPGVIVMGSKGKPGALYRFIGSVAGRVVERCRTPVLVVPSGSKIRDPNEISAVAYATDFDKKDLDSFEELMNLLAPFRLRYYCLHVDTDDYTARDEARMQKMREHFFENYEGIKVHCEVIHGEDVAGRIDHYVENHSVGLVAVTSRKRSFLKRLFFPGTTQKIIFESQVPVLVFHH